MLIAKYKFHKSSSDLQIANDPVFGRLAIKRNESRHDHSNHKNRQRSKPNNGFVASTVFSTQAADSQSELATSRRVQIV